MLRVDVRVGSRVPPTPPTLIPNIHPPQPPHLGLTGPTPWSRMELSPLWQTTKKPLLVTFFVYLTKARGFIYSQIPQPLLTYETNVCWYIFPQRAFGCHVTIVWPCNTSGLCRIFKIVPWPDITHLFRAQISTLMKALTCKAAGHGGDSVQTEPWPICLASCYLAPSRL